MATRTLIGADIRRREDPALVQGAGRFVDDLAPSRLVFTSVLRSPHAHARLRRLDTMRAAAIPGVLRVITARDVDGTVDPEPAVGIPPAARRPARPLLARDVVRYVGEPVAVVVAEDRYVAADACEQIDAEYDPQPAVGDLDAALAPGAPRVHAQFPDNVAAHVGLERGRRGRRFRARPHGRPAAREEPAPGRRRARAARLRGRVPWRHAHGLGGHSDAAPLAVRPRPDPATARVRGPRDRARRGRRIRLQDQLL